MITADSEVGIKVIEYYITPLDIDLDSIDELQSFIMYNDEDRPILNKGTDNIIYAKITDNNNTVIYIRSDGVVINDEIIATGSPQVSPIVTPSASPEVSPSTSPVVIPSASPEASPSTSPVVTPSASPEVSPSTGPVITPSASPSTITSNPSQTIKLPASKNDTSLRSLNIRQLPKPKGLVLTSKKAKWKNVKNNNGYILRILQGKKLIKTVQIKKGRTNYKIPRKLFKTGKRYRFTIVAKGIGSFKNSKAAKSKLVKITA
ncbi:MAG: hypothetical protein LBR68_01930 [Lachnoclostridium sp.]|nr:hypothetical protein [Lachnoclostridium sp.]